VNRLLLLGLNHATAPLEVRERLAFAADKRRAATEQFRDRFPDAELVVLSTCNRVELYVARAAHARPRADEIAQFLAAAQDVDAAALRPHLYEKTDRQVVEHLFAVACSLDSMVLGETQILGQVREAYEAAAAAGSAGPALHPLMQRAIAVGKQVMHETALGEGRTSVASVAVEYARQIFDTFEDKTVLCVGAGKMAALVLQNLAALRPGRLVVCNRDVAKARRLAEPFGGAAEPFDRLAELLVAADVVLTSTGACEPVITRKLFDSLRRQRRYRPLFLIDIAVPRDVEPAVGEVENVYLYNLDDLQRVVATTSTQRRSAVDAAGAIVARAVEEYVVAHRAREMGPVIDRLYKRYHAIATEELNRTLGKLPNVSDAERAHLEELARRIVNKLLNDPVQALRRGTDAHAPAGQYLHALERLFRLAEDERAAPAGEADGGDPAR